MKQFMIIIDGPMGSGKTTIGELIHQKLKRTALLSTDRIKWFISDFKRGPEDNALTAKVMMKMCEEYTKQGINLLIPQGFWKREYIEPYLILAKENNLELFFYQLEANTDDLLGRIDKRGKAVLAKTPVPKSRIKNNIKTWAENRYELGKVFDTSKLTAMQVANKIVKEVKEKIG